MKPQCIIIDSDDDHARTIAGMAQDCGFETAVARSLEESLSCNSPADFDLLFLELDPADSDLRERLSDADLIDNTEIFVMSEFDDPALADRAIRAGASYYFCKPLDSEYLIPLLEDIAGEVIAQSSDATLSEECGIDQFGLLRGSSRSMRKLYRQIRKVANSDVSVMVIGESGTGKELVAQTIHMLSPRREMPFVAFNCAAVPEHLAESELFGHEKGAFSGAVRRHRGFFERAHGGVLLLDEITEMDIELQAKMLRVLEAGTIKRLGSEQDIAVDVRILSASNRDPEEAIRAGLLREDLYYRLAQFPLRVPPLSKRGGDVVGLAQHFLRELNAYHDTDLTFSQAALNAISDYHWPGNVRELKHLLERAYILSDDIIDSEVQIAIDSQSTTLEEQGDVITLPVGTSIAEAEKRLILATLEYTRDDKQKTADTLGISLKTLYNRLNDYADR